MGKFKTLHHEGRMYKSVTQIQKKFVPPIILFVTVL